MSFITRCASNFYWLVLSRDVLSQLLGAYIDIRFNIMQAWLKNYALYAGHTLYHNNIECGKGVNKTIYLVHFKAISCSEGVDTARWYVKP